MLICRSVYYTNGQITLAVVYAIDELHFRIDKILSYMQWFCRFLRRGRIVLKLGGNCVRRIVRGANCPDTLDFSLFNRRVLSKLVPFLIVI